MTITRIVMDKDVDTPGKTFVAGEVYDSRFPADMPAASDGIQHCISQERLDFFVAQGFAHEQTLNEWTATLTARRTAMLASPDTDEETKQLIRQQNAYAASAIVAIDAISKAPFRPQPMPPHHPATLETMGIEV